MGREQAPAFQFYVRDWLASGSVAVMTLDERGAYVTLMARCWLMVELPFDAAELAALALTDGRWWAKHGERVMRRFTKTDTGYRHDRLDEERAKQAGWIEKSVAGGEASARARRLKNGSAQPRTTTRTTLRTSVEPPPKPNGQPFPNTAFASASASASAEQDPSSAGADAPIDVTAEFRTTWEAHPHTPRVLDWTRERLATIRKRLKDGHDLLALVQAFDESGFLAGTRPRGPGHESFRATVDWCLKPANLVKILEGAYADAGTNGLASAAAAIPASIHHQAKRVRDTSWGRCRHEPRCDEYAACVDLIARELVAQQEQHA